jgi:dUTP pyrophosphatase
MKAVARFEKVSLKQFELDYDLSSNKKEIYDEIKLPARATTGSAGYDFYSPIDFTLAPGQTIKIPTGIRCFI